MDKNTRNETLEYYGDELRVPASLLDQNHQVRQLINLLESMPDHKIEFAISELQNIAQSCYQH